LLGSVAVLAALGGANLHQRNFSLFLAVVVGLSTLIAVAFVATERKGE